MLRLGVFGVDSNDEAGLREGWARLRRPLRLRALRGLRGLLSLPAALLTLDLTATGAFKEPRSGRCKGLRRRAAGSWAGPELSTGARFDLARGD